jgi:L-histidine N-alpha-methyltransferase
MGHSTQHTVIRDHLEEQRERAAREEILAGLQASPKFIPCVFLYDERGSELFEQITRLEEYYPPRKELPLLRGLARQMGEAWEGVDVVELGSGGCSKISVILNSIPPELRRTVRYVPLDVSRSAIEQSVAVLSRRFDGIRIQAMVADFRNHMHLIPCERPRVFCFLGSTIGNLSREQARAFLTELSDHMQTGDVLLLGLDMVKEKEVLERAYNDEKGVTARFNKNVLNVVNRHLETSFDPSDFDHVAFYDEELCRIEMHLRARRGVLEESPFSEENISLRAGETIHTENSHKFTQQHLQDLAEICGLELAGKAQDQKEWFSVARMVK